MSLPPAMIHGQGLVARALRGTAVTVLGTFAAMAIRLAGNLILTRPLFPEAFGLAALLVVVMTGLQLLSDAGLATSIHQNPRGDDRDFLDTAWTIQIARGVLLWLAATALAVPAASFFAAPELAAMLPVAALSMLLAGFYPTKVETVARHLVLGRLMLIDLATQVAALAATVLLALWLQSVWALVLGLLVPPLVRLPMVHRWIPGPGNRLRLEPAAVRQLVGFGKWVLLSTAATFLLMQGDKLILGRILALDALGLYNMGYFLASFPMLVASAIAHRILIPLYRDGAVRRDPGHARQVRRMRFGHTGAHLAALAVMAAIGVPLVGILYDPRYAAAGAVVVAVACVQMPVLIGMSYEPAALAEGDSRGYFLTVAARAALQTAGLLAGAQTAGLPGALAGMGLAACIGHLATVRLARRHGVWDPRHDALFLTLGAAAAAAALAAQPAVIDTLRALSGR